MKLSRYSCSTATVFSAALLALGVGCGAGDEEALGTDEGEVTIEPGTHQGRLLLSAPAGVDTTGFSARLEDVDGRNSMALRMNGATRMRPRKDACLNLYARNGEPHMRDCGIAVVAKQDTSYALAGLAASMPSHGVDFGRRPGMIVEMIRSGGRAPYRVSDGEFNARPILAGTYRASYTGIAALAGREVTATVAGGSVESLVLPDPKDVLSTIEVVPPANVVLPNAPCSLGVEVIYDRDDTNKSDERDVTAGGTLRVYPLSSTASARYLLRQIDAYETLMLTPGATKRIELGRIEVSHPVIDDGVHPKTVRGTYTVYRKLGGKTKRVSCDHVATGTGVTVLPGQYSVEVDYVVDGRPKHESHVVTVP